MKTHRGVLRGAPFGQSPPQFYFMPGGDKLFLFGTLLRPYTFALPVNHSFKTNAAEKP